MVVCGVEQLRLTAELKPFKDDTVTTGFGVTTAGVGPLGTVPDDGLTEIEKSGPDKTLRNSSRARRSPAVAVGLPGFLFQE